MNNRNLTYEKSAIHYRLKKFGTALQAVPPLISRSSQLFFLCGANSGVNTPSKRREAVKQFIENLSPQYRVIYAEGIFNELTKISTSKNVLDLEHEISSIADKIVIVLESESAFCELGAFAHKSLRDKLIIINNSAYKKSNSFINTGPISAAIEAKSPVLWYPMNDNGIHKLDGIGATFNGLKIALNASSSKGSTRIKSDISVLTTKKESLYFIHDLVLITGPVTHHELIEILIATFGNKPYDLLSRLLGILKEARLIYGFDVGDKRVFKAAGTDTFLKYDNNIYPLIASFRRHHLTNNPQRFFSV